MAAPGITPPAPEQIPHVAPLLAPSRAVQMTCPVDRQKCCAGACPMWDWVMPPTVKARVGVSPPEPPAIQSWADSDGYGKCSIPRRSWKFAQLAAQQRGKR